MYAKLSRKGQVTIPKRIREILNIGMDGNVLFIVENNEVKIKGIPAPDVEKLAGSLKKYAGKYVDLKIIRKEIEMQVAEEIAKEGLK